MKELVVISGKGGTGKTSITASLATLAESVVLADCDVDAADLHLVLGPTIRRREDFSGGSKARILSEACTVCGECAAVCRFEAIHFEGPGNELVDRTFRVDPIACEGCGLCAYVCSYGAVDFQPVTNGEWYLSDTRCGPMVHARLFAGEENSGKLVSVVRREAKQLAEREQKELVLIDGSPGIGCPVIASLTGVDLALIVTEPTLSGRHGSGRVIELVEHFGLAACLCVNKWDLNPELADQIEREAAERGIAVLTRIRYDRAVTDAQIELRTVVEHTQEGVGADLCELWESVAALLAAPQSSKAISDGL